MKEIILYRNKGVALVDDEDFNWLSQYRWHLDRGYAAMTIKKPQKGIMYMHRLINQTPKGMSTDHINRNKLDNRKANLRTCTQSLNNANSTQRTDNTSGVKGVVWHKRNERWQAQVTFQKKNYYLGQFTDKRDAIRARNRAALSFFGEFVNVDL